MVGALGGGSTSIVEIHGGANVALSRLSVSGPGLNSCADGSLGNGVAVFDGAHLDLTSAAVRHIHDTPLANCFPGGLGIVVGDPFSTNATATIRQSEISDFAGVGIIVFNEGWITKRSAQRREHRSRRSSAAASLPRLSAGRNGA